MTETTNHDWRYDLLIVQQHTPYTSARANEALDLALAAGSFDQRVAILFIEDGVYQLMAEQAPDSLQQKNLEKMLNATTLYGISLLALESHSLFERDIHPEKHLNPKLELEHMNSKSIQALYDQSKTVIRF